MTIYDWLPSISTTALLALLLWISRSWLAARLKASIAHEYNKEIELVRSEHRQAEAAHQSAISEQQAKLASLREAVLETTGSRHAEVQLRRLNAAQSLWNAVLDLRHAKVGAETLKAVKFEGALKIAAEKEEFRSLFKALVNPQDPQRMKSLIADESRPYLSDISWAYFSTYRRILGLATGQILMLQLGVNMPQILKTDDIRSLVEVALPHRKEFVEQFGDVAYFYLLEELEEKILAEVKAMIEGRESDASAVERARRVLEVIGKMDAAAAQEQAEEKAAKAKQ